MCDETRTVEVGRLEIDLKCEVDRHRGGSCRMVIPGTDVIIMWPGKYAYRENK